MTRPSRLLLAVTLGVLIAVTSTVQARTVKCLIETPDEVFQGPCDFDPEQKGSFSLSATPGSGRFLSTASVVSVSIYAPGQADVRGLTRDGINSRWGDARRSSQDRACWRGADFLVCAW
jgi:hypothetical protein